MCIDKDIEKKTARYGRRDIDRVRNIVIVRELEKGTLKLGKCIEPESGRQRDKVISRSIDMDIQIKTKREK